MRYVAAYVLATLGGNKSPSSSDIEKILGSVGIEVDQEKANKVISELKGKDIDEVIENGKGKLASVPSGGAVVVAGGGGAPAGDAGAGSPAKEEAKKEEKKEESEESDEDMGFGLFD